MKLKCWRLRPSEEPPTETITYSRKKWTDSRETNLEKLPVDTLHYELPEEEQVCACCGGELYPMSTETRNEISVIPAEVRVLRHIDRSTPAAGVNAKRFRRRSSQLPMPKSVYPGSLASQSILAHVMTQKYVESQPLYRQEQQFAGMDLTLSRQMLAMEIDNNRSEWAIIAVCDWTQKLAICEYPSQSQGQCSDLQRNGTGKRERTKSVSVLEVSI